ncbi:MAG: ABC transporter substrate-binding protein [Gammaproteobacteria bacterium]|nr:ABC transporter substrate-binding protein [Gammaproteobacteria bacterium]
MRLLLAAGLLLGMSAAQGEVRVRDDAGQELRLAQPARRVVSLAPHLAEMVAALGGTAQLAGVTRFSDFPAELKDKPRVGDAHALDRERLLSLKPDLLLIWRGGLSQDRIEALKALHIPLYQNDITRLDDVAGSLERIGLLLGRGEVGRDAAVRFRAELAALRQAAPGVEPVPVFYQIWHEPLYTVGAGHWLNDLLALCGARNVFAALPSLAPAVSREAVLATDVRAIVLSNASEEARSGWRRFPAFRPEREQRYCLLDADESERPGPRLLLAARELCQCTTRWNEQSAVSVEGR